MRPELIHTRDGSHSLLRADLNETYHSVHGAITESNYIYIDHGLAAGDFESPIHVFEMGFGTGLNILCAYHWAITTQTPVHITTIELTPLPLDIIQQLNYTEQLPYTEFFDWLHTCEWETRQHYSPLFSVHKIQRSICHANLPIGRYDCIFYDAFAPKYQPDCWTDDILSNVVQSLRPNGIFITYCCTSQLQRTLRKHPVKLIKHPGPPGKREILQGIRLAKSGD